jgi:hypothetical protein
MPSDAPSTPDPALVHFVFGAYGGNLTGVCPMKYTGLPIKSYLRCEPLRQHGLMNRVLSGGVRNRRGEKVRLTYVPLAGDVIVIR